MLSIQSFPKINLALDILGKDSSGYHEIRTVFHQLSEPYDELVFESLRNGEIEVVCDDPKVPCDETNTVFAAALLLQEHFGITRGVRIIIKKNIPLMTGLGGGASNAVAALKGLAELWSVKCHCEPRRNIVAKQSYSVQHEPSCFLFSLAAKIGMDCAFFINGGTSLGEHFGEKITPLPPLPPELKFEIIETGVEVKTREAYEAVDLKKCSRNIAKTQKLIAAIRAGDTQGVSENIHNDFEEFIFGKYPEICKIARGKIAQNSKSRILLCGSGGCLVKVSLRA